MAREAGFNLNFRITGSNEALDRLVDLARADEREACAKVCDRVVEGKDPDDIHSDSQWAALSLAAAIRARSNHD
jgi:hypothetical protein